MSKKALKRSSWDRLIGPKLAAKARSIALEVGRRVCDPGVVRAGSSRAILAGFLHRTAPSEGWHETAGRLLSGALGKIKDPGAKIDLFFPEGLVVLGFAADLMARIDPSFMKLAKDLDSVIFTLLQRQAAHVRGLRGGMWTREFDLYGLSGLAGYALSRRRFPAAATALESALGAFLAIADGGGPVPHWHTPYSLLKGAEDDADFYPYGMLNCSLMHGISGPLSVMALASRLGSGLPGQRETIRRLAAWLAAQGRPHEGTMIRSRGVPVLPASGGKLARPRRASAIAKAMQQPGFHLNSALCFGAPGILRTLWNAGVALDDRSFRDLAVSEMAAVSRNLPERVLKSPIFCHGLAGVLQIVLRFAHDTGAPAFREIAVALTERLVESFDPKTPYGFRPLDYVQAGYPPEGDHIDILQGAPGVALVLLAAASDIEPDWDRLFLLS